MRINGIVKEWHDGSGEGWGYIDGEDGIKYSVHWSEVKMPGHYTLEKGMKVSFEPREFEGDIFAVSVKVEE